MEYKNLSLEEKRIVQYIKQNSLQEENNSPEKSDPRMYVMNLLYYTFCWTDEKIAFLLNRNRSTITTGRKKAFEREKMNDKLFINNTHVVRFMFPDCNLSTSKSIKIKDIRYTFYCKLSKSRIRKLNKFKKEQMLYNYNDTVNALIDKFL